MRRLLTAMITLLLLVLLAAPVSAEGTAATAVTAMRTECVVESDGACAVTLRFTVEFAPDTENFAIPISPAAREIYCSVPYQLRSGDNCKLLVLEGNWSGRTELTVSYRLAETVTDDGKAQKFFVQLLYPAWTCQISGYEVELRLPGSFESLPAFWSGYYGDLIDNYMDVSIDEGVIRAVLNPKQILLDREAMSIELELPRDFFDLRFLAGKTVGVDRLLFLGLLGMAALFWLIFLRNLPILPKRQAMPPEGGNAGEVPYLLTDRAPDLALMVVQWASLGYLTVSRTRRGRLWLNRQIDMDTERKQVEREIFGALFARGDRCDLRSAEFLKAKRLAAEKPREFWKERIFDPKGGSPLIFRLLALAAGLVLCLACFDLLIASKSWRWYLIVPLTLLGTGACLGLQQLGGCLLRRHSLRTLILYLICAVALTVLGKKSGLTALMLLNLLLQTAVGLLLRCGGRRTKEGAALAAELLGYRRWLLSASSEQLKSNLEADPQFFYRVLPFADALCVSRPLAGGLDGVRLEECDWLIWEGKPLRTAPAFYARYRRLMAGLRGERDPGAKRRPAKPKQQRPVSTRSAPPARGSDRPRAAVPSRNSSSRSRSASARSRAPQTRGNKSGSRDVKGGKHE